jgi:hypothetical protein
MYNWAMLTLPAPAALSVEMIVSYYDDFDPEAHAPEGYGVKAVEYLGRDEDMSHDESIVRVTFAPLPPAIECDTAPLTHRMNLKRAA